MGKRSLLIATAALWVLPPIALLAASNASKVYIRNLLFSEVYSDQDIPDERSLEHLLSRKIKYPRDGDLAAASRSPSEYQALLGRVRSSMDSQEFFGACAQVAARAGLRLSPDDCLAIKVAAGISHEFMGVRCGLEESLAERFSLIQKGVGCCSDFNDAFAIQASVMGLKTREVNNQVHTTSEYYDRNERRWKWVGTSYRTLMADKNGRLLSAYAIRGSNPWDRIRVVDAPPFDKEGFSTIGYEGHYSSKNALQFWNLNSNPAYVFSRERWLIEKGFPRSYVQLFSFLTGVRSGYLFLASPYTAWAFKLLQFIVKLLVLIWAALPLAACIYLVFIRSKSKPSEG